MKHTSSALLLGLIASAITGCGGAGGNNLATDGSKSAQESEQVRNSATGDLNTESSQHVVAGQNSFGLKLFGGLATSQQTNMMLSPVSLHMALGMALNGASGETKSQMSKVLGVAGVSDDAINATAKAMIMLSANIDPKVELLIANSVWTNAQIEFNADFLKKNEDSFGAEVSSIDFSNPKALETINGWVNQKTKGRIPTILDQIAGNAGAYLINAVYFKGLWKDQFSKDNTHEAPFALAAGNSINTPMMNRRGDYEYFEAPTFQALRLPYGSDRLGMTIVLPAESEKIDAVAAKFSDETLEAISNGFKTLETDVSIPKFTFATQLKLKDPLMRIGMPLAFDPAKADFRAMRSKGELFIQDVVQKTWIQVDEQGTEAAASTSVEVGVTSIRQTVKFIVNRPFMFFITDKVTKQIFFAGLVRDPRGT
ncbi:MAG: serpin family protein [Fimbriimonadales bacterium]